MIAARDIEEIKYDPETVITVGTFDGVHLGHRQIISEVNRVKSEKNLRSVVVTFDPHPQIVLKNRSKDIKILSTTEEKLEKLSLLGIDEVLMINFTKEFSRTSAEDFYKSYLIDRIGLSYLVLGYDHMFGKNREGNFDTLKELSVKYDFKVDKVSEFKVDGEHVSSTVIRVLLQNGEIRKANKFLGEPYEISGKVFEGKKIGSGIGYPTANIKAYDENKLIPKNGIYTVKVFTGNQSYFGMMNIGYNPTVTDEKDLKLEVNIFDFDKNIYGENIKIEFLEYHREEKKFDKIEELVDQLLKDKEESLKLIKEIN